MTLTKDDLEFLDRIGAWTHVGLKGKILKNQKDSEELQKAPSYRQFWIDYPKYAKIVERLKERKEDFYRKFDSMDDYHTGKWLRDEFQKIIGEKNGN